MNEALAWWMESSWLFVGSLSGSFVAMLAARNLTIRGRLQTLLVGTVTGCISGPAICEIWFSSFDPQISRVPSFICFLSGLVALAVVPVVIKRFKDGAAGWNIKLVKESPDDRG